MVAELRPLDGLTQTEDIVVSGEYLDVLKEHVHQTPEWLAKAFQHEGEQVRNQGSDIEQLVKLIERYRRADEDPDYIDAISIIQDLVSGDEARITAIHERIAEKKARAHTCFVLAELIETRHDNFSVFGQLVHEAGVEIGPVEAAEPPVTAAVFDQDAEDLEVAEPLTLETVLGSYDERADELLPAHEKEDRLIILAQQVCGAYDEHVRGNTILTGLRKGIIGLGKSIDAHALLEKAEELGIKMLPLIYQLESLDPEELDITQPDIQAALIVRARLIQYKPQYYERLRDRAFRDHTSAMSQAPRSQSPKVQVTSTVRRRHAS